MASADRLIQVFNEAKARPAEAERRRFVAEACADDPELKQQVLSLLQAHEGAGDFLKNTLLISPTVQITEKPGDRIGRYKLLQKIGEGGCGVVYMAEQEEPVRRRVALKVIKLGMDTHSVIARFEAERQALALMDHPNIAKVFDAGATDMGRPFFVMELVRGTKITDYCDQNNLTTEERLKLFTQVCHAIQHAHQKGVIHRDIKPSNILVTVSEPGSPGCPKVIDFGIAKATTGQRLTDKTVFTAFEQFIGTPTYMSPEQAMMTSLDVDTRADIYALGVLLYELLTGQTPFDAKDLMAAGLDAMRHIIREQEPARPSTRLSTMLAADLTIVAQHRHAEPGRLGTLLRGDLDWIVMKALEKDRSRRYDTANDLAADIQRHLSDEPVVARPPAKLYRFQKLVRRNKLAFAATSAVTAALMIGLGISTWMFLKEKQARQRALAAEKTQSQLRQQAETEASKSRQVAQFLRDMLKGVGPSAALGRDTTMLREILDATAERVGKDLKAQPEVEAEMRGTIDAVYWELGEYGKSEAMHRQALALWRQLHGNEDLRVAGSFYELAQALWRLGNIAEAVTANRESLRIRKELLGNGDHPAIAASFDSLAFALWRQGELGEAETSERLALAMRRKLFGDEHPDVATSLDNLALILWTVGKLDEAELSVRQALTMKRKLWGNEHLNVGYSLNNLTLILIDRDKFGEAEAVAREALAIRRKLLGNRHPEVAATVINLSKILQKAGKISEAEALFAEWMEHLRARVAPDDPELASALAEFSSTLVAAGKFIEAEPPARECLTIREKKIPDEWQTFNARNLLAGSLLGQKRYAEAETLLLSAAAGSRQRQEKLPRNGRIRLRESFARLGQLYEATGQAGKAAEWKTKLAEFDKTEAEKNAALPKP